MASKIHKPAQAHRRDVLKGAAVLGAAGVFAISPLRGLRAQETHKFRMAHAEAMGSPMTEAFERWGEVLNERSEGRIEAEHFPAGQLGNYTQLIEGSRLGTIQATAGGPDTEEAVAPEIAAAGGAPGFIYRDYDHVDRVLQGELAEEISRIAREKTGVEFVAYGEVGFRHLLSKRPVTNLEELSGLKIRVPELRVWVDFWEMLGSNPTPLAYAEQYNALSTGVIDALEADPFSIQGFKWHEQAPHLTMTYHWFLPKAVRVNAEWLDGLPEDLQELVRSSAEEVFAEQRQTNRDNVDQAFEDLKAEGLEVHELTDADQWRARTEPLFDEFAEKGPEVAEMIDKIRSLA